MKLLLLSLASISLLWSCTDTPQTELAIIPVPVETVRADGEFKLDKSVKVYVSADNAAIADGAAMLARTLGGAVGGPLEVSSEPVSSGIIIEKLMADSAGNEEYTLKVSPSAITIGANTYSGVYYAMQTLMQLMPPSVYGTQAVSDYAIPCVEIRDFPRFAWRGVMLDVSRHFFPVEQLYRLADAMGMQKLNKLHLHLTDAVGWRIEIEKYPRLTEVAAWRKGPSVFGDDATVPPVKPENAYGGFYTKAQMRDFVTYAAARGVTVVPEIEMPGHTSGVFAAYPQYSCSGKGGGAFCAGNDQVYSFLEDVLDEVIEVFPSEYIHIGGDEVGKGEWKACPKCQARMRAEKLADEDQLQSYFVERMTKYVASKGRQMIGWDEIMDGGLAEGAVVMSWRGTKGGIEAAKLGHDVIMTPTTYCYLDYYQNNPAVEPEALGGFITTKKVYGYNPMPADLPADKAVHILGVQGNLWTEYIQSGEQVEYMLFPRLTAIAESGWSQNDKKDWSDFNRRLDVEMQRFEAMGLNYHKGVDIVYFQPTIDLAGGKVNVALESDIFNSEIYYTIDGSEPTTNSLKYSDPISLTSPVWIRATIAKNGEIAAKAISERFIGMHKAMGKNVAYNIPYNPKYKAAAEATLVDGITGSLDPADGLLQGFEAVNLDVTIDLGAVQQFTTVSASFFQGSGMWIFMPRDLVIYTSDNGTDFKEVGRTANHKFKQGENTQYREMIDVKGDFSGRYVRVVAVNGTTPEGFPAPEIPNWIFCDEIFVY